MIRGVIRDEPMGNESRDFPTSNHRRHFHKRGAHRVVVTSEHELVVVGVDARDRAGLLLDISKGLSRLNLNLRHTEASVVGNRSISIWRCELIDHELPDLEEIWSVLNVSERRGLQVSLRHRLLSGRKSLGITGNRVR